MCSETASLGTKTWDQEKRKTSPKLHECDNAGQCDVNDVRTACRTELCGEPSWIGDTRLSKKVSKYTVAKNASINFDTWEIKGNLQIKEVIVVPCYILV